MARVTNKDRFGNMLNLDQMLRRFKKQVEKDGILVDVRKHEYFVSKSVRRKIKSERHQRLVRKLEKKKSK